MVTVRDEEEASKKQIVERGKMDGDDDASSLEVIDKHFATGKRKFVGSESGVSKTNVSASVGRKVASQEDEDDDDDEPPEELTNRMVVKRMHKERKQLRDSVFKNPFHCPNLKAQNWTEKDDEDYRNWLLYEKSHRGLTLEEQDYLVTDGVNVPTGSKTYYPK